MGCSSSLQDIFASRATIAAIFAAGGAWERSMLVGVAGRSWQVWRALET